MATAIRETAEAKSKRLTGTNGTDITRAFVVEGEKRAHVVTVFVHGVSNIPFGGNCDCKHGREKVVARETAGHDEAIATPYEEACSHLRWAINEVKGE
jgi:hypothetical protein